MSRSLLRDAAFVSAGFLLMGAIVATVVAAGCGGNGGSTTSGAPDVTARDGVIDVTGTGSLDSLAVKDVRLGDEIAVTGSEWTNGQSPVRVYLLTSEQVEDRVVFPGNLVKLAEEWPEDGAISFRFRLADNYQTPNGDQVRIEAGQQWRLQACQDTEDVSGLHGAHCSARGPLTVVE